MECDICYREYDAKRLPFLCAVDARNHLYEGRYKHLQISLENEALQQEISDLLANTAQPHPDTVAVARSSQRRAEARTSQILAAADQLRNDIKVARDEIQARKAVIARRRSDLATISGALPERRVKQQQELDKATQRLTYRWSQSAESMASTRGFLCAEAAEIYGLRRFSNRGSKGIDEYQIGKAPVVDLLDMNSLSPEVITTSLGHISHLLILASHYLSIRLPAEITLPHRDYPYPTIFNTSSSYRHGNLSFPGTPGATTPVYPTTDSGSKRLPRARPLYVHKPLTQLLKDDPATYSFFVEGVALLAYDIAWLCSTQGIVLSEKNTFEDVCQMGRNLWYLLVESQRQPTKRLPFFRPSYDAEGASDAGKGNESFWNGRFSHGTSYYFLGGPEGADLIKTFKVPSPSRIADKLKKKLVGDAPIPDWELLEDEAWKVEDVQSEPNSEPQSPTGKRAAKETTRKSSNGWTKLRS